MKKFFKILSLTLVSLIGVLYLVFLVVPPFINLEKYRPQIVKLVKDNSKLNLNYSKMQLYTTPLLSAGVILKDVNVTFDDNTSILKTDKIKTGISLPSLFTLTVKTAYTTIDNPLINLEITDGKQYKIVSLIETIINENIKNPKPEKEKSEQDIKNEEIITWVIEHLRIKVPIIKIANYKLDVNDPTTKNNLALSGEELKLGYWSKNSTAKLQTIAHLYSNEKENILADLNIKTIVPEIKKNSQKEETDPDEIVEIPFINIIDIYQKYDLKTNVTSKLRIKKDKEGNRFAFGFFDVDNLTLKLSNIQLPESYFHSKFNGERITYDSYIFVKNDEKLDVAGFIQMGKNPRLKTALASNDIHFVNVLDLLEGLLDSLNIKNDINEINATGYLNANAMIDTDFKKLTSQGSIKVIEGAFINKKNNIGIKDIAANILFDNNAINIKDANAIINGSKVTLEGSIDNTSFADIKLSANNLSVPALYNAFAPDELRKAYKLTSLNVTSDVNLKGKLDNLTATAKAKLSDLALSDAKKTMFISNKNLDADLNADTKNIKAKLSDTGFSFNMPSSKIYTNVNSLLINVDNEKVAINPFELIYNKKSKINVKGNITNYLKDPKLDIFLNGLISTDDIKTTLGKEVSYYLISKGNIPFKVAVTGDIKTQNVLAQLHSNKSNYITPVDLKELVGANTLLQGDIKIKGNKIHIKNSGLFKMAQGSFTDNLNQNQLNKKELVELSAIIDGDHINLLRLSIPNSLSGKLSIMKKSSFKVTGKLIGNGKISNPNFLGNLKISDINLPELSTNIKSIGINLLAKSVTVDADDVDLNGSKLTASFKTSLVPMKVFHITDIKAKSEAIDVDKVLVVADSLMKYLPPASSSSSSKGGHSADIPLYAEGKFAIKKITTGQIVLNHTLGHLKILNNNLILEKLRTRGFNGTMSGKITMNLITQLLTVQMTGENIDSNLMLTQAASMKDMLTGTMSFKTNINLKGTTYEEQVKSLKGTVEFSMKDGQYGPFAKLENFFLAKNIRENPIFKATIGAILSPILTIDSTHFEELKGKLNFNNGIVNLAPIASRGDILCILIKGDMNLLTNTIESKVRVRLASTVSDLLGPLALANPVNLIKNTPGLNIATAKLFTFFSQVVTEQEYKEIPDFSSKHSDKNATKFQIVLSGDVTKPVKLVKSFKWLSLQSDYDKAKSFSDNYVKEQEALAREELMKKLQEQYEMDNRVKVGIQKVLQMDTTAPEVKKMLAEEAQKAIHEKVETVSKEAQNKAQESIIKTQEALQAKKDEAVSKIQSKIQNSIQEKLQNVIPQNTATSSASANSTNQNTQETSKTSTENTTQPKSETKQEVKQEVKQEENKITETKPKQDAAKESAADTKTSQDESKAEESAKKGQN